MKKSELLEVLKELDIDVSTLSIESEEPEFGTCDISEIQGNTYICKVATTDHKQIVELEIGSWLLQGKLGKLAGFF